LSYFTRFGLKLIQHCDERKTNEMQFQCKPYI
jgi:hypothetical protein